MPSEAPEAARASEEDHAPNSDMSIDGDPRLPGIERVDERLIGLLAGALAAQGDAYRPRTHHLHAERPIYTNRLIRERSPYLLQHAHNPVNWFPWGEEAFARARSENKPIFLSIGYSTCHWCHVMERESFEDEEIAALINRHFIPIKVDREERPDIDAIYMRAVYALAGRGGWPMTVLLTPGLDPFFAGTYFPPRAGARRAARGLVEILEERAAAYRDDPEAVLAEAARVSERVRVAARPARPGSVPGAQAIESAARQLAGSFDPAHGGFGRAPKFPQPSRLMLLLRYARRTGDAGARRMLVETLAGMAAGGICDQVGGGFHRYSTDARWLVPHFEKMLYDNAQLALVYLEAWQLTGERSFARVAREILDYVRREMTSPGGGFYSATDADSETPEGHHEEGYFFTWTLPELRTALAPEEARLIERLYRVTASGNFEERNILHLEGSREEARAELGLSPRVFEARLASARETLYQSRASRPSPGLDDKILTAWNGLMVTAFARGALVLGEARYLESAARAARFVLDEMRDEEGRLLRSYRGEAHHRAYLDDHAMMVEGLIELYEASGEIGWLREALALQAEQDEHYATPEGGYFLTADDAEPLLARDRPSQDGAMPSGNSVSALNLLRLSLLTGQDALRARAERLFSASSLSLSQGGSGLGRMLTALDFYLDTPLEVVLLIPDGGSAEALLPALRESYLPNRSLSFVHAADVAEHTALIPLLDGKVAQGGALTAYVCERGRCELPTSELRVFRRQLARAAPLIEPAPAPLLVGTPTPAPWSYDRAQDRHWHPGHRHFHPGPPPPPGERR